MNLAFNPAAHWNDLASWFVARSGAPAADHKPVAPRLQRQRRAVMASPERQLAAGGTLRVEQALGTEIVCLSGMLWITHAGEDDDHIVVAGKPYVARHDSTMLVHAMSDARCLVIEPRE